MYVCIVFCACSWLASSQPIDICICCWAHLPCQGQYLQWKRGAADGYIYHSAYADKNEGPIGNPYKYIIYIYVCIYIYNTAWVLGATMCARPSFVGHTGGSVYGPYGPIYMGSYMGPYGSIWAPMGSYVGPDGPLYGVICVHIGSI